MQSAPYASTSARATGNVVFPDRFRRAPVEQRPLLTKQQLATYLAVSTRTVDRYVQAGMPYRSVAGRRRFMLHEVEVWVGPA